MDNYIYDEKDIKDILNLFFLNDNLLYLYEIFIDGKNLRFLFLSNELNVENFKSNLQLKEIFKAREFIIKIHFEDIISEISNEILNIRTKKDIILSSDDSINTMKIIINFGFRLLYIPKFIIDKNSQDD